MPLAPNRRIGAYEIVSALGAGGMGEVYRARDLRLGREVALKVLPPDVVNEPGRLERFDREARAIAALNHPHIVTIYSTEEADGVRFLTMELVEGCTLNDVILSSGMTLPRFLEIALPLADALCAAHQKQITHRDLKPSNVMVSNDGRVKVLDFGLARVGSGDGTEQLRTATVAPITDQGRMIGTMPYMSPEQVEGRPLDPRSDLFSLGVVFYELLTGHRPFKGSSSPALMSAILRDTPTSVCELRPDLPDPIDHLVSRLLEKRPEDRVQTARDVFNELRHIKGDSPATPRLAPLRPARGNLAVAVQPFDARGADHQAQELARDLGEEIANGLARFGYLRVVSSPTPAAQARYSLSGQVRRAGQSFRISAKLVDTVSSATLWAENYSGSVGEDAFALEDRIASAVIGAVGDETGVLIRSMAASIAEVPLEQLSVSELVVRYHVYLDELRPDEHARLRTAFETALQREPRAAEGWGCLAILCEHEYGFRYNPLPNTLQRHRWAAERALALDPRSQIGWSAITGVNLFARDLGGVRAAVERSAALNPHNTDLVARGAWMLSLAGDHDRALDLMSEIRRKKPQPPASWHFVPFNAAYARGDDERALQEARLLWMPAPPVSNLATAAAAGQLGRAAEARRAIAGLRQHHPELAHVEAARQLWTTWIIDQPFIDRLVDGFQKALALSADSTDEGTGPKPPSSSAGTRASLRSALSVAVLPFVARSSDDESRTLAEGLTDDITTALSRFGYIGVLSRSIVEQLTREHTHVRTQARYTIEGHVRRAGSTIRTSLALVDTHTGTNLWSNTYDRDATAGAFALQDDISSAAVAAIGDTSGVLIRSMAASIADKPIDDLSVGELAVRFNMYVANFRPDEHARLRSGFERALEQEAPSAEGWACLSLLYEHEYAFGINTLPGALERHRRAALKAVEIDPHSQTAWVAMARAEVFARDQAALNAAVEHIVTINPLNADLVALAGFYLSIAGEYERGSAIVRGAITRKAHHPSWYRLTLFNGHFAAGRYEPALHEIQLISRSLMPLAALAGAAVSGALGRAAEARLYLDALRDIHPMLLTPEGVSGVWRLWYLDEAFIESMVDGFKKALDL